MKIKKRGAKYMSKKINIILSVMQLTLVLLTVINIVFCLISCTHTIFLGSLDFCFAPYFRYIKKGNLLELIALVLFIAITIFLSIKTLIETINKKENNDVKYTLVNFSWIFSSMLTSMPLIIELEDYLPIFSRVGSLICIILLLVIFICKVNNKNKSNFANYCRQKNITYQKTYKTVKKIPLLYLGLFSFVLLFRYYTYYLVGLNNLFVFIMNVVYLTGAYFAVGYFITSVKSFNYLKNNKNEHCPYTSFFKKICSLQIISFLLFILSYVFLCFTKQLNTL